MRLSPSPPSRVLVCFKHEKTLYRHRELLVSRLRFCNAKKLNGRWFDVVFSKLASPCQYQINTMYLAFDADRRSFMNI